MAGQARVSYFSKAVWVRNDTQSAEPVSKSCEFDTLVVPIMLCKDFHAMNPAEISKLIQDGLPCAEVRIVSDDNTHFEALVISDAFAGKRPLARHQMVYQCLGSLMGNEIHALSIRAHTCEEWAG